MRAKVAKKLTLDFDESTTIINRNYGIIKSLRLVFVLAKKNLLWYFQIKALKTKQEVNM